MVFQLHTLGATFTIREGASMRGLTQDDRDFHADVQTAADLAAALLTCRRLTIDTDQGPVVFGVPEGGLGCYVTQTVKRGAQFV